jgi:hypothetical protein
MGAWFNTDLSFADPVTGAIDLKLNGMKASVKRS